MKVLELFKGTGSVSKGILEVYPEAEIISVDIEKKYKPTICCNILDFDYKKYKVGEFDIIWGSPPCHTFSRLRNSWIGRKLKSHGDTIITKEIIEQDIKDFGLPILRKAEEIIDYLKPKYYFIENPQTGKMKNYISRPFYDVDYCRYGFDYKKRTRIWTNKEIKPKLCEGKCGKIKEGTKQHLTNINRITKLQDRYRIPQELIKELVL